MQIEILTKEELQRFKSELIEEIKKTIRTNETLTNKRFLRSSEVRTMLKISSGTLQNLRIEGRLPYEKIGGIFYYAHADIEQFLGGIRNS
ncbi:helix-turn-helix domain-containing protein [Pedobacter sp. MR2016-24]|uniref:helix-turn-helix domain-containing protein n=1 Tax=Pedobacter sp. MR2016-24 TaxID=2994466 RepID=UPI00224632D4|nr:helix-turn-helix domain-containing protein [Pedobacter sp. MR2016-24]MCX2483694.1 helix-turn-helix domain-containing protein [Pedobacter sp. MR2016-24]